MHDKLITDCVDQLDNEIGRTVNEKQMRIVGPSLVLFRIAMINFDRIAAAMEKLANAKNR